MWNTILKCLHFLYISPFVSFAYTSNSHSAFFNIVHIEMITIRMFQLCFIPFDILLPRFPCSPCIKVLGHSHGQAFTPPFACVYNLISLLTAYTFSGLLLFYFTRTWRDDVPLTYNQRTIEDFRKSINSGISETTGSISFINLLKVPHTFPCLLAF